MANALTEITLDALHNAIREQLAAAFPDFATVEFYRDDESEQIPVPALLLEMQDVEPTPGGDGGTGQLSADLRFVARVILSARSATARMECRKAACAVGAWLHQRRFTGIATDSVSIVGIGPDEFAPNLDRFAVWTVEWSLNAMLGASAWKPGAPPEAGFYSFAPRIGLAHREDYRELEGSRP